MPNAQVYVVPYPTDQPTLYVDACTAPDDFRRWSIDSFISPADYVGWVFVAFAVALLPNALIVVFFRSRELVRTLMPACTNLAAEGGRKREESKRTFVFFRYTINGAHTRAIC